ncbi:hypothetical protein OUZ56_006651 [Daphnia magna]|uniref:Uncharacterized protein n=1 Tax=Daphnia magna TaxID=35525 RepID=A0ABQ9YWQ3_9CRUS|nr:hypothetical protein OUZ56_006651 [Daphnia magna]
MALTDGNLFGGSPWQPNRLLMYAFNFIFGTRRSTSLLRDHRPAALIHQRLARSCIHRSLFTSGKYHLPNCIMETCRFITRLTSPTSHVLLLHFMRKPNT